MTSISFFLCGPPVSRRPPAACDGDVGGSSRNLSRLVVVSQALPVAQYAEFAPECLQIDVVVSHDVPLVNGVVPADVCWGVAASVQQQALAVILAQRTSKPLNQSAFRNWNADPSY
jgi:hypothetical protein